MAGGSTADRRRSTSSKGYHNSAATYPESSANDYVQVAVEPLDGVISAFRGVNYLRALMAIARSLLPTSLHSSIALSAALLFAAFALIVCLLHLLDLPLVFLRLALVLFFLFGVACVFCSFALVFRHTWTTSCAYVLFCSSVIGEIASNVSLTFDGFSSAEDVGSHESQPNALVITPHRLRPSELSVFLLTVVTATSFNRLSTWTNALLIGLVTLIRYLAYTTLADLPTVLRPYLAYIAGIGGIVIAKYTETLFRSTISTATNSEGKFIAVRRRRTSAGIHSSTVGHCSSGMSSSSAVRNRRTSLPALSIQRTHHGNHIFQVSSSSLDVGLLSEAHGLLSDMLADKTSLPPHIISGLQALSNLLSPPNHTSPHQQRQRGAGVSLADFSGSDTEENLPYTGERPSALPKRFKKYVPQSLLRRMSTSTWTTTTSATGMPTLEPEPCRKRSTSFRNPPELSPTGGMSSSLSLPTSISNAHTHCLQLDLNCSVLQSAPMSRKGNSIKERERKTVCSFHPLTPSEIQRIQSDSKEAKSLSHDIPDFRIDDHRNDYEEPSMPMQVQVQKSVANKQGVSTSDYDSCESPCGSEVSENTNAVYDRPDSVVEANIQSLQSVQDLNASDSESALDSKNIPRVSISSEHQDINNTSLTTHESRISNFNNLSLNSSDLENFSNHPLLDCISEWDYPIFELEDGFPDYILSKMCHRVFLEVGLFETFKIPMKEFFNYFHTLEGGYRNKPYHNKMHAADVLHAVYYLTSQAIPGFVQIPLDSSDSYNSDNSDNSSPGLQQRQSFVVDDSYGVMGGNVPALELMALYTAAAMHDYDHPGRTNAFLVTTNAPLAVLYNDRSVLENHHAAAAWSLFMSDPSFNFLKHLDKAEFKRFRFLVIEAILATDLKRHFEILTEFNAKVNIDEAPGIDWQSEADRMLVMQMCIKLADINGPCKQMDLHTHWTYRIAEEFYEQGDEEYKIGLPVSPFMDRKNPQLAKLQESFINHLVAPLCNAYGESGLLPGQWVSSPDVSDEEDSDTVKSETDSKDTEEDEGSFSDINIDSQIQRHINRVPAKKILCLPAKHIQDNYDYWITILKDQKKSPNPSRSPSPCEELLSESSSSTLPGSRKGSDEMETIHEEELNLTNNQPSILPSELP